MIKKDYSCAVLVNSCDKYEDAWKPFFKLVQKYWPDCPYPFYLNTEHKPFSVEGLEVEVLNINDAAASLPWGQRLKECLARIPSEYVILFLEDFFLQAPVNQEELERCIGLMEDDPNNVAIYFKQIYGFNEEYEKNPKYYIQRENKMYKLNLQAGLWRKADLEALIKNEDSPWSFEFEAQERIEDPNKIFLCSKAGTHNGFEGAVFPYLTGRITGYGIWTGKWLWNNDKLFKKNGIETGPISLVRFTRWDMLKYYLNRLKQIVSKKTQSRI